MDVSPGTHLGPYEIVAPLGAGGMGEVWKARDTRLDRSVAIKILPTEFASNAMLRTRFEREAKTISQLNHPNICSLYDVGEDYLVMELLEGETLADRLGRGPLPINETLKNGAQIADALDRAHRAGIVHRDLKPGNIMLTRSGAKLLDFGLAKGGGQATTPVDLTEQKPLTQEGTILGTFQYMAPEQLEGLEADARTDIFALGAVLYEMATGKRAFEGKTKTSLIAAIVSGIPAPMSRVQPVTPPALEHVVSKCLEKDPDNRWHSAHDIAEELAWIAQSSTEAAAVRVRPRALPSIAAGIAGLLIGATATWLTTRGTTKPEPVARFNVSLPANAPLFFGAETSVAISPDGTRVIYRAKDAGELTHLYTRSIGQLVPTQIPGPDARMPSFSPDGRSIVFNSERKLLKLSLDGSVPVSLCEVTRGNLGSDWFGNTIYYNDGFVGGIKAVGENGGQPRQVIKTDPARGIRAIVWPQVLPGGKTIMATVWNNGSWDDAKIVAFPIAGGEPRTLLDGGSCARYVPGGHLVYQRGGSLFAVPFDAGRLAITGPAVPVIQGIATGTTNGEAHYAVSENGTLVYVPGGVMQVERALMWVDRKGNEQPVVPTLRPYTDPRLSPDGRTIAVTLETATFDIWLLDLERDSLSRLSFGGDDSESIWSNDGQRVFWVSTRTGQSNIFTAPADASRSEERYVASDHDQWVREMSPDGKLLIGTEYRPGTGFDVVTMPVTANPKPQPIIASRFNEQGASFSPDGKWIIYASDESGRFEIYIRPFPGPGGKWQVSTGGADEAYFAHNQREIFYRHGSKHYVVSIELGSHLRVGRPQLLFDKPYRSWGGVSLDDQRFLVVRDTTPRTANEIRIVLNWFEDLRQRVHAK